MVYAFANRDLRAPAGCYSIFLSGPIPTDAMKLISQLVRHQIDINSFEKVSLEHFGENKSQDLNSSSSGFSVTEQFGNPRLSD
jgi:hypothetical protein